MGSLPIVILLIAQSQDPQTPSPADSPPPITGIGRLEWTVHSTIGPPGLWTGVLSSTWGTVFDHPREYGESFDGFAKRYGLRLTGVATSNVTEATLGAIWGEDPRYHPSSKIGSPQSFGGRFSRTLKMTFLSRNRDGGWSPAYARYIAIAGTNVLSDAWRPNSDRGPVNTIDRIGLGFGGRLLGNLYEEFWPDVRKHLFFFNKH